MSTPITFNGVAYSVPAYNDTGYAQGAGNLSSYLIALASGTLQQTGGTFALTADANFGTNFGLAAKYYKSTTANIATAGTIRLAHTDTIDWRNTANNGNLVLAVDNSDNLTYQGNTVLTSAGGSFVSSITGTADEIIASSPTGAVVLSTPQPIAATSSPTFVRVTAGVTSPTATPATAGVIRLANTDAIDWRNAANNANLPLTVNASDQLVYNGNVISTSGAGPVTSITGTTNQIIASSPTGAVTLSTPQNIDTGANVTFNGGVHSSTGAEFTGALNLGSILGSGPGSDGTINLYNATNGFIATIKSAITAANYTVTWPTAQGGVDTFLKNNGSGVLTWGSPSGSGTVNAGTSTHLAYYATSTNAVSDASGATISGNYTLSGVWAFDNTVQIRNGHVLSVFNNANTFSADIQAPTLAANRALTIPDPLAAAEFVLSAGASTIGSVKTFSAQDVHQAGISITGVTSSSSIIATTSQATGVVAQFLNTENATGTADSSITIQVGGASAGDAFEKFTVNGVQSWAMGIDNSASDVFCLQTGSSLNATNAALTARVSDGAVAIRGTTTNDSAAAGFVGEYISSTVTSSVTGSTTLGTFTDTGCSIALTAGDWDVDAFACIEIGGVVGVDPVAAITRFVITDNANTVVASGIGGFATTTLNHQFIPHNLKVRISISGATTYKTRFTAISNSGTPTYTTLSANVFASGTSNLTLVARRVR